MTNELVHVIPAHMAKLNITYGGQQGDLPDPVSYDSSDADIKQWVSEALQGGNVPGIGHAPDPDLTDFVVDRFPAHPDVPFNRVSVRPKTAFGLAKKIWKFPFTPNSAIDSQSKIEVMMPQGALVRYVDVDSNGHPCLWAEVDTTALLVARKFYSVGTGHGNVPEDGYYLGTVVMQAGYVFHIYEKTNN